MRCRCRIQTSFRYPHKSFYLLEWRMEISWWLAFNYRKKSYRIKDTDQTWKWFFKMGYPGKKWVVCKNFRASHNWRAWTGQAAYPFPLFAGLYTKGVHHPGFHNSYCNTCHQCPSLPCIVCIDRGNTSYNSTVPLRNCACNEQFVCCIYDARHQTAGWKCESGN